MEIESQHVLPAPRPLVWALLNDVDVLRGCIPGCESLEVDEDGRMSATVAVKIGPIRARFAGEVEIVDAIPPQSYAIVGEGKGGVAGFAKGRADVKLEDHEGGTLLSYTVNVQIGGKIAQLGGRLIASTSRKLSEQFFDCFAREVEQRAAASQA